MHGQHATCNMEAREQTVNGKRCEIHCEISIKYLPSPLFHHSPPCHATGFSLPHCARCIKRALKLAYCTLFAVILIYPPLSLSRSACCALLLLHSPRRRCRRAGNEASGRKGGGSCHHDQADTQRRGAQEQNRETRFLGSNR